MQWPIEPEVEQEVAAVEAIARRQRVARRIGAVLFAGVFLLDVFGDPQLVAAVSRLCGS